LSREVVITGVGCVSPNGVGRDRFADACETGRSGLSRPPDLAGYESLRTSSLGSIPEAWLDPRELLAPAELKRVPRVVPLALSACREAMEQADLRPEGVAMSRRVGLVLGSGGGGLAFVEEQYRKFFAGNSGGSPWAITGGTHGNLAGELSIHLGLRGPSHVVSTGCASSTDALGYAKLLIRQGICDAVVCGGADAPIAPGILRGFERMGVISTARHGDPQDASRPFSASRDGFVLGEGAWMFVVERRGWREVAPLARLAGYAATSDAYHRVRIDPDLAECVRAMTDALTDAGLQPDDVDTVNLHGTGTEMNDRLESRAMRALLGDKVMAVPMTATKSLIGHPQGAGGSAGIAASLLSGLRGMVPPTRNVEDLDPDCRLDLVTAEARRVAVRTILCNCIAFGSKNSALVLELPG
jgi:3-oxoacyl-[acyl-carrier-protein] synthase II